MTTAARPLLYRVAGAPISWGVCEAPGWGHEIGPDRVLTEMHDLGLRATELGPTGYLGARVEDVAALLAAHDLRLIGGFLPVVLHAETLDLKEVTDAAATLAAAGAEVAVLAARSLDGSYDRKVRLDDHQWRVLVGNLATVASAVADLGLLPTLHPHVGTAVEDRDAVMRLLEASDIALTLDTGHLLIGGTDPVELAKAVPDRIAHVHLKDVHADVAERVRSGAGGFSYMDGVRAPLYAPLGEGDVDVAAVVGALEANGYQGWYVLEQDCALTGEPPAGQGPLGDVRTSVEFLAGLAR